VNAENDCACCEPESQADACPCPGGLSGKFLQPCLLLLLSQEASYGYVLMDRLQRLGAPSDASAVYRMLRRMEQEGLVSSEWNTEGVGPAKRYYRITPEGEELLHTWTAAVRRDKEVLEGFLDLYTKRFKSRG
jgi:poly-beta-hydroxybutyrate-responsive repressor